MLPIIPQQNVLLVFGTSLFSYYFDNLDVLPKCTVEQIHNEPSAVESD